MRILKKRNTTRYICTAAICLMLLTTTQALAQPGNALAFDGVNDYVQVPDNGALDFGANNFTVEYWVYKRGTHQHGGVGKWNTGATLGTNEWILTLNTGGNNIPLFWIESGTTIYQANATTNLAFNQWYHIAGVRDGSQIRIYVNGVQEGFASVGAAVVNNIGRDLLMGKLFSNNPSDLVYDEVRIWNVARTQAQIQAAKDFSVAPTTTGLLAYYQFETGTGGGTNTGLTTVTDATANSLSGMLMNSDLSGTSSNWITSTAPINPTVLPVRHISLQAVRQGTSVQLDWQTIGEENQLQYDVERSVGGAFVTIATLAALNTSRAAYQWIDADPLLSNALYRVRATDAAGHIQYSTVVPVKAAGTAAVDMTIYPNPVQGQFINIQLTGKSGTYTIQWFNASGQQLMSSTINHPGSTYTHVLSVSALPAKGRYSLRLLKGSEVLVAAPVIKQ